MHLLTVISGVMASMFYLCTLRHLGKGKVFAFRLAAALAVVLVTLSEALRIYEMHYMTAFIPWVHFGGHVLIFAAMLLLIYGGLVAHDFFSAMDLRRR